MRRGAGVSVTTSSNSEMSDPERAQQLSFCFFLGDRETHGGRLVRPPHLAGGGSSEGV